MKTKTKLNIDLLPPRKEGYTVKELVKRFNTTSNVVNTWLSKIKNGYFPELGVERIRTEDRFKVFKVSKGRKK